MDGQQEEPVLPPETVAQRMSRPIYFPVSPLKLVVLATCTFGLYEIYWFYRHWGVVRERHNSGIMPFARAFFAHCSAIHSLREFRPLECPVIYRGLSLRVLSLLGGLFSRFLQGCPTRSG